MPLNKETKTSQAIIIILLLVWLHLNKTALEVNHFCLVPRLFFYKDVFGIK